jgi:hypothetical protein
MIAFLAPFLWGARTLMGFFSRPPGSYIGIALAAIVAVWWYGQHEFNRGHLAAQFEALNAAVPIIAKQNDITTRVVTKYIAVKADDQAKTIIRIKEVPVHVTEKADAACPVSLGFVRVFNDAAHGPVPPAAAGTDDSPLRRCTL